MNVISYWQRKHYYCRANVVIIGGGIVGVSAAVSLKSLRPTWRIVVIERGSIPEGASTRNAGFACIGSMTELLDDLEETPEEEVFSLAEKRWKGLLHLRAELGDAALRYVPAGGYELFLASDEAKWEQCLNHRAVFNHHFRQITGTEMFIPADNQIQELGLIGGKHLMFHKGEGQLDAGAMMRAWYQKAREIGIVFLMGRMVSEWEEQGEGMHIQLDDQTQLLSDQLLVTTNGYTRRILPELQIQPARNQVWVTEPIPNFPLKGNVHYDKGYVYFREVDQRLLVGGARNLDRVGETTDELGGNERIYQHLETFIQQTFDWDSLPPIALRWSGILGFGPNKQPVVRRLSSRESVAVGLGGMGVAIGTLMGEEAAQMVLGGES